MPFSKRLRGVRGEPLPASRFLESGDLLNQRQFKKNGRRVYDYQRVPNWRKKQKNDAQARVFQSPSKNKEAVHGDPQAAVG